LENNKNSSLFDKLRQEILQAEEKGDPMGWNEPSNMVWTNIDQQLGSKDHRWLGFIPWILAALLALLSFYLWQGQRDKLQQLQQQKQELQLISDSLEYLKEQCDPKNNQNQSNENSRLGGTGHIPSNGIDKNGSNQALVGNKSPIENEKNKFKEHTPLAVFDSFSSLSSSILSLGENQHSLWQGEFLEDLSFRYRQSRILYNADENMQRADFSSLAILPGIQITPLIMDFDPLKAENLGTFSKAVEDNALIPPWSLGLHFAAGMTHSQLNGTLDPAGEDLNINKQPGLAYAFELMITRSLGNRLSISTGMGFRAMQPRTEYSVRLPYDPAQETQNVDGNYHLDFQHSLPASVGKIDLNFGLLRLSSDQMNAGDTVELSFNGVQRFEMLSLPIRVNYNVLNNDRFSLQFGAGMRVNYLINEETRVAEFNVKHTKLHNRYALMHSPVKQFNEWTYDVLGVAEARYRFHRQFFLHLGLQADIPLRALYKSEGIRTRIYNYTLRTGVSYNW
jgi:hypothetical protein